MKRRSWQFTVRRRGSPLSRPKWLTRLHFRQRKRAMAERALPDGLAYFEGGSISRREIAEAVADTEDPTGFTDSAGLPG